MPFIADLTLILRATESKTRNTRARSSVNYVSCATYANVIRALLGVCRWRGGKDATLLRFRMIIHSKTHLPRNLVSLFHYRLFPPGHECARRSFGLLSLLDRPFPYASTRSKRDRVVKLQRKREGEKSWLPFSTFLAENSGERRLNLTKISIKISFLETCSQDFLKTLSDDYAKFR